MMDTVTKIMIDRSAEHYWNCNKRNQARPNKTDIADAVKRLDSLTQEEARMAAAQVLKATHAVDNTGGVRGVADIALGIDNRVAVVGDQVQVVVDQVQGVSDQVQDVNDKVTAVMDRAQNIF